MPDDTEDDSARADDICDSQEALDSEQVCDNQWYDIFVNSTEPKTRMNWNCNFWILINKNCSQD